MLHGAHRIPMHPSCHLPYVQIVVPCHRSNVLDAILIRHQHLQYRRRLQQTAASQAGIHILQEVVAMTCTAVLFSFHSALDTHSQHMCSVRQKGMDCPPPTQTNPKEKKKKRGKNKKSNPPHTRRCTHMEEENDDKLAGGHT